jgi:hypothetical protein
MEHTSEVEDARVFSSHRLPCPFVYSGGKKCCGALIGYRLYGHHGGSVMTAKKVRLWCSDKDDHAGPDSSWAAKERMEFYPDKLRGDIFGAIETEVAT